jgi:hypothetical protein
MMEGHGPTFNRLAAENSHTCAGNVLGDIVKSVYQVDIMGALTNLQGLREF